MALAQAGRPVSAGHLLSLGLLRATAAGLQALPGTGILAQTGSFRDCSMAMIPLALAEAIATSLAGISYRGSDAANLR